ncbi:MAG: MaoC family dehydratase [Proteobacteria bacterium]|nr:MaoC family dehydratase [Pseudomonadota bacterium]
MAPTVIPNIAAIKDFVGKPLGTTDWVAVTQDQINSFADATGDHQWIHLDAERAARESPFGGTVAHGYLTLALVPALLPQVLDVRDTSMAVNYGVERMRLPAPVRAGTRVRLSAEIKDSRAMPSGAARTIVHVRIEAEGSRKPACTADVVFVYYP